MNERLICWRGIWYICHAADMHGTPWWAERDGSMVCTAAQAEADYPLPSGMTVEAFFERAHDPFDRARGVDLLIFPSYRKLGEWSASSQGFGGDGATLGAAIQSVYDHIVRYRRRPLEV